MGEREKPVPLVEPVIVPTVFLSGVECEDLHDGTVIFMGYVSQRNPLDESMERIVVTRHIMTKVGLLHAMLKTAKQIFGWTLAGEVWGREGDGNHAKHH